MALKLGELNGDVKQVTRLKDNWTVCQRSALFQLCHFVSTLVGFIRVELLYCMKGQLNAHF